MYGLSLLIEEAVFDPALVSQKKGIPQELLWTGPEYDPLLVRPGENADRRNPEAMIRLENRIYAHMARIDRNLSPRGGRGDGSRRSIHEYEDA